MVYHFMRMYITKLMTSAFVVLYVDWTFFAEFYFMKEELIRGVSVK